jgi:CHAD domain-containing protein/CYTH domain-containing protein
MPPRVDNLRESTHRAVRLVALGHLADASAARDRLKDSSDHEALHDFRVALRRLRSWERAFRPYLRGDLSKKLRRRLRNVAGDTGASRDLEVHLSWLVEQRRSLGRRQRPGLSWILANLRQQKTEADSLLQHDVGSRFGRLESKLRKALETYRERVRLRDDGSAVQPPAFADVLAPRVRDAASDLREHLDRIQSAVDQRDCHEARISAKRLRYLLEPVARSVRGASDVVERLKSMQDVLGDLHDAQVFGAEISELATEAARVTAPDAEVVRSNGGSRRVEPREEVIESGSNPAPTDASTETPGEPVATASAESEEAQTVVVPTRTRAPAQLAPAVDPLPGIMALSDRLRDRETAAFSQFAAEWLGEQSAAFFRDVDAVADRIAEAARAGVEIERKFLLSQLPAEARGGRRLDIDQGYIPGDELHERIRRVSIRHGGGRLEVHYYRTVKLGEGVARTEIEEETTQAIFDVLWPLTRRRRLRKRRYEVDADGVTWEIDDFKHRDLVLAEIELEAEDAEVAFPEWLAPVIQREVTKDPEFQNINLAR